MTEKKDKAKEWANQRVQELQRLKSPTDAQKLLIELHSMKRDENDEHTYKALIKAERAADRAARAAAEARKLTTQSREDARRKRTHKLVILGLAFERAGIGDWTEAETTGLLQMLKKQGNLMAARNEARAEGEKFLAPPPPPPAPASSDQDPDNDNDIPFYPDSDDIPPVVNALKRS